MGARYGEGLIYHTKDGGDRWEKQDSGTKEHLQDVFITDKYKYNGWAVGLNGTILHTSTGGVKWSRQESTLEPEKFGGVPISITLSSVYFTYEKSWFNIYTLP